MLSESEQIGLLISSLSNLKGEDKHWKGYRFYIVRNTTGKILDVACVLIGKGIIEVLGKEKDWTTIGIQPDFVLVLVLNKRFLRLVKRFS